MNSTQKAIAATFYRLVRDKKMRLKDVPDVFRKHLAAYKKSQKGLISNEDNFKTTKKITDIVDDVLF